MNFVVGCHHCRYLARTPNVVNFETRICAGSMRVRQAAVADRPAEGSPRFAIFDLVR